MAILEVKNLKCHFRLNSKQVVHAVDDVSFKIESNEILGLVGESGSGKSTLGKTILGLLDKTSGTVVYAGKELPQKYKPEDFIKYSKTMQMIFQDPYSSLNPRMTVGEIIGESLYLQGGSKDSHDLVSKWLRNVGLEPDHMSRYAHEFSGGQRQRIGIARAMISKPKFVVCDEPISALDVSVQAQIINLLNDLKTSTGLTLLFIAHDLSMVRYVSDRIAVMYLGSIVEIGKADDVFFRPMHPYSSLLSKSNPEPDPEKEKTRKHQPIVGEIPSAINVPLGCRFASRCPHAMANCLTISPPLISIIDASNNEVRQVACHLYPEANAIVNVAPILNQP